MSELQACFIRDEFLIKLNYCKNQVNTKFKQISDNLLIRQNQLLAELDGIENKYSESRNAENELKQIEKYRHVHNKDLNDSNVPLNIISRIKHMIKGIDDDIADLRQKLVTYTNIDIELDTDNINTLIDKLGSVKLTEDGEYNPCVNYITNTCDIIDPCESYNPYNKNNNNTIVFTDALGNKKREQGNSMSNNSPIEDEDIVPETGLFDSQSSSSEQIMVQYNTLFILNKNECPVNSSLDRPVVLRNSSTHPGTATQLNNEVNSKHQSVYLDKFSKQTPDVNISPRSKSFSSKDTALNQDVNDKSLPGNAACRNSNKQKNSESEDKKRENAKYETLGKYEILSPQGISTDLDSHVYIEYREPTDVDENSKAANKDSPQPNSEKSFESFKFSERSADTHSRTNSTASNNNDSSVCFASCNDEVWYPQDTVGTTPETQTGTISETQTGTIPDTETGARPDTETGARPDTETVNIVGGIYRKEKQKKSLKERVSKIILPTKQKFL